MQKFTIDHTYTFDLTKLEFCIYNTDINFGRTTKYIYNFFYFNIFMPTL